MAAGTVLAASAGTAAADVVTNLYVTADAGAVLQQNADLHQPGLPTDIARFHTGTRGDIAIGYNLSESFALELEPGFMWNSVDTLNGLKFGPGNSIDLYSVPVLVNAIYKFPTRSGFTPYAGAGIGLNVGTFDGTAPSRTFSASDVTFAYQVEGGVKYALCKHASVGVAYKFFGTTDQDYSLPDERVTLAGVYVHGLFGSLTMNF